MKKIISLIIVLALMISAFSVLTVNAAEIEWSSDASLMNANGETGVTYKLTSNIAGSLRLQGQEIAIDLAGYTWQHNGTAIILETGSIHVYDSVGGGKLIVTQNDAVSMGNGVAVFEDITINAGGDGMDALFVNGGNLTVRNCTLAGNKAGINAANASEAVDANARAVVTVDSCTFANSTLGTDSQGRNCAIEIRANADEIFLSGNNVFTNNKIISKTSNVKSIEEAITIADGCSATFTSVANVADYTAATIAYSSNGETPATEAPATEAPATEAPATEAPAYEEVETPIDISTLPTCGNFTAAGFPEDKMFLNFQSGGANSATKHSIGVIDLANYDKIVITYGSHYPLTDDIGTVVLKGAADITSTILKPTLGWTDTTTKATFDVSNATNNEELFIELAEASGNGFVISEIVLVSIVETDAPATDAPATDAPATEAPATEAPATEAPATEAPSQDVPTVPTTLNVDISKLPTCGQFTAALYPADQMLLNFFTGGGNDSGTHSIGVIDLSAYNTMTITYATDSTAQSVGTMVLKNAAGDVIATKVITPSTGWQNTTTVTFDISAATNNEELFLSLTEATNGMAISAITLEGETVADDDNGSTDTDVDVDVDADDSDTGDVMSFVIVIAAAALIVTVLSKKRVY